MEALEARFAGNRTILALLKEVQALGDEMLPSAAVAAFPVLWPPFHHPTRTLQFSGAAILDGQTIQPLLGQTARTVQFPQGTATLDGQQM